MEHKQNKMATVQDVKIKYHNTKHATMNGWTKIDNGCKDQEDNKWMRQVPSQSVQWKVRWKRWHKVERGEEESKRKMEKIQCKECKKWKRRECL